jgi:hypothetical protein
MAKLPLPYIYYLPLEWAMFENWFCANEPSSQSHWKKKHHFFFLTVCSFPVYAVEDYIVDDLPMGGPPDDAQLLQVNL